MNSEQIKKLMYDLGAEICGIAPVERFNEAPKGFHPNDIWPEAKSVVAFAKQIPSWVIFANSPVPYTSSEDVMLAEILNIGNKAAIALENQGINAIPVPSEPYEYWDKETMTGKGILSLKHAGQLAGIGVFGKNTLLYTPRYGCMVKLGALLVSNELEPDPVMEYDMGCDNCGQCVAECPSGAIMDNTVLQKPCRQQAHFKNEKGYELMVCNTCRKVCPNYKGFNVA
jgi:epoxyqueuosine reductase